MTMRLLGRSIRSQATSTLDMLSRFFSAMAKSGLPATHATR
jgi:hypothetical protein